MGEYTGTPRYAMGRKENIPKENTEEVREFGDGIRTTAVMLSTATSQVLVCELLSDWPVI
jgi:hypothetical protein